MAAQTACVAPDVLPGVAPSAGPTIGTSSSGAISTCETVSENTFVSRCESYAGSYKDHFATQIAAIGHGTADTQSMPVIAAKNLRWLCCALWGESTFRHDDNK